MPSQQGASRRRWSSLKRDFLPKSSLRTRISSCKYSITSCWFRFIQPDRQRSTNTNGFTAESCQSSLEIASARNSHLHHNIMQQFPHKFEHLDTSSTTKRDHLGRREINAETRADTIKLLRHWIRNHFPEVQFLHLAVLISHIKTLRVAAGHNGESVGRSHRTALS